MANTQRQDGSAGRRGAKTGRPHKRMAASSLLGRWRIVEMSEWDKKDINIEGQAYISVRRSGMGEFRFGLTEGSLDGSFKRAPEGWLFDFTWEGYDECDHVFGDGWMRMRDADTAEGEIRFHAGDVSKFRARRSKNGIVGEKGPEDRKGE